MVGMSVFDALGVPFQYCLEGLTHAFAAVGPLNAIGAFGLAVIATTIIIRGALFPIFGWQLRTSRRIQAEQRKVAPDIAELRKKYKREPQKLSAEMQKVYAQHGISPFSSLSGCLPALVQAPVLIGLYRGISAATSHLSATGRGFLWIHDVAQSGGAACCAIAKTASHAASTDWTRIATQPEVLILPLLAAALTFVQSRMMMPPPRPDMTDQERTMTNVTRQMSFLFPVMIFIFSLNFVQGLALYWATGTLFMVLQQYHLVGWGSLKVPPWFPGAGRVTPLSFPSGPAAPARPVAPKALPAGKRSRDSNGKASEAQEPTPAPVAAGAVNAPPLRPPKRRNGKRRRQ